MSRLWSPGIAALTPYVPGEQPKIVNLNKLNTNENPWGPSPRALEAIRSATSDALRLYPDPSAEQLRDTIARYHGLAREQVFVGNGSDEVLAFAFFALLRQSLPLLFPDITYSFYPVYCGLFGIQATRVPLTDAMEIRVEDYRQPCGAIIIANPNAPTGVGLPLGAIRTLLEDHPEQVVVVDEAYVDFGADSAVGLVNDYDNLLVVHTLSKSRSLAGLRVGFALGQAPLIDALERVKNSFNSYPLGRLAQAGAIAAFEDEEHFQRTRREIMETRAGLVERLTALGFQVLPSVANFVFARHRAQDGAKLAAGLRERGIIVRHFARPRIDQYLRITVGTQAQCVALTDALVTLLGA